MNKDEIDIMWQQAMRQSIEAGEMYIRYHFAKMIAAKEREACADLLEHGYIDDEGHHVQYAKEIRARGEQA